MQKSIKSIINFSGRLFSTIIILPILISILFSSISYARDFENKTCTNLIFVDDSNGELLSLSFYNNELTFQPGINSSNLKSLLFKTHINAIYHYEKSEFELGLSNTFLNNYLFDGMKLEFQANPQTGSGVILFIMAL